MHQFSGSPVKLRLIHKLLTEQYLFSIEYQVFCRGAGQRLIRMTARRRCQVWQDLDITLICCWFLLV